MIEKFSSEEKIVLPTCIAPFDLYVVPSNMKQIDRAYEICSRLNSDTFILDDSNRTFGEKMGDAEMIGVNKVMIVGEDTRGNTVQVKDASNGSISVEEY